MSLMGDLSELARALEHAVVPYLADGVLQDIATLDARGWLHVGCMALISYLGVRAIATPATTALSPRTRRLR